MNCPQCGGRATRYAFATSDQYLGGPCGHVWPAMTEECYAAEMAAKYPEVYGR